MTINILALLILFPLIQLSFANEDLLCGPPPGVLSKLFTDAEEIHLKCLKQNDERNHVRVLREVAELQEVSKQLDAEIKLTAISYTISTVKCAPGAGEKRDPKIVARCKAALTARIGVINRVDKLMGWKKQFVDTPLRDVSTSKPKEPSDFPCPTSPELDRMKPARSFNKRLNEIWTRCTIDSQI